MQAIILASSSRYRAELLGRLGQSVETLSPDIDESALGHESAAETAIRLARMKAERVAASRIDGIIIGSDQVPICEPALEPAQRLGKPGNLETARAQLKFLSGKSVHFYTAICLIDAASNRRFCACDDTLVQMRNLEPDEIERYLEKEPALDCAGSFKAERLGISLFESIDSEDPTALVGLPLISVCRGLRELGISIP